MTTKEEKQLRDQIASLSSGPYYDEVYQWRIKLEDILMGFNITSIDECPQIYNDEGRQVTNFTDHETQKSYSVFWTYYRMPSGRWEIVCYLT